ALVSGKVKVGLSKDERQESLMLQSGEMAEMNYKEGNLILGKFNLEQVTAWKDGTIYFADAGIEEIVTTLENWYGVDIQTAGYPKTDWKFNAKFENESLYTVMEALKYAQNMAYELKDKELIIKFNNITYD